MYLLQSCTTQLSHQQSSQAWAIQPVVADSFACSLAIPFTCKQAPYIHIIYYYSDFHQLCISIGILSHQGPLGPKHKDQKGSNFNFLIEWETGEIFKEPLTTTDKKGVYDTDPITVAIYARNTAYWTPSDGDYLE